MPLSPYLAPARSPRVGCPFCPVVEVFVMLVLAVGLVLALAWLIQQF